MTSMVSLYNCLVTISFWVVIVQEIRSLEGFYINNHYSVKCNLSRTISSRIKDSEICSPSLLFGSRSPQDEARIESVKSGVAGGVAGAISLAPVAALHNIAYGEESVVNGLAQWEFDTDMGVIQAALFAIVYRYCIRQDDNSMLNQGVVSAFVLVRTLSKIKIPAYCSSLPLDCGDPLGFLDWSILLQLGWGLLESGALFGVTAAAMDYCFRRGIIAKFRG